MKLSIKTINLIVLFLLTIPCHIFAAQQAPQLVQAKPMNSTKKSTSWWKNPWVYVASASLVASAAIATYFGIEVAKTGVPKPAPKKTQEQAQADKIEAIVEEPSPQEQQMLEGLSPLKLYQEQVGYKQAASPQAQSEYEELVFGVIFDLTNNAKYRFDADKTIFNSISLEIDKFVNKNYRDLARYINSVTNMQQKQQILNAELNTNLTFNIDYYHRLNELYIEAIENYGNKEINKELVNFLDKNVIMNPKGAPTH